MNRITRRGKFAALTAIAIATAGPACADRAWSAERPTDDGTVNGADLPRKTTPIIVTGTRIRIDETAPLEPLVQIDRAYQEERNLSHIADALNESPGFRGSLTPDGAQSSYGQGVNFISAFGLGSQRTLTLVNGRRFVSSNGPTLFATASPGTQVDINAIPSNLVDRVDRIAIGGAPVYGSDAIAGTVNIVLRRRLTGIETSALAGVTEQGDNFRWKLAAAGGRDFNEGRGNVTIAVSFDRAEGVSATDRAFYRDNLGSATNPCTTFQPGLCTPFGTVAFLGPAGRTPANDGRVNPNIGFNDSLSDGNPGSVLVRQFGLAAIARGGLISSGPGSYSLRFAPDGSIIPYDRGTIFGAPLSGPFAPAALSSGGEGLKLLNFVPVTSRIERFNAAALFDYELTDGIRLFAETFYYRGEADEPVDLPTFNGVLFQGASGALTFRTDNPFLSDAARDQLAALGYGQTFQLSRANTDLADRSGSSRSEVWRIVAGAEGEVSLAGRAYKWEATVNYGRTDFTDFGQAIDQQRFVNAINVARIDGEIVCSTEQTVTGLPAGMAPIADSACVPLNLFGEGAPSRAARDYVLTDTVAKSRLEQLVFNANIGGSPFNIFGNAAAFNLGFEHRREKAAFNPDAFLQSGLGRSVAIEPVAGSYNLDEVFGEVVLPFITPDNGTIISSLTAFGRFRHVDSSTNGGFTSWSAGGSIAPVRDLLLRGNFTRSFRSPAILELFSPRAGISTPVPDLCSSANIDAGPVPEIRRANCTAFLGRYPNATPLIAATATVPGIAGGNPDLRNESAESFTFGAVLRPRFIPGLTITADYLDIRITDPIANLGINQIAQGCFDNPTFDIDDPANGNGFCSLIRRDADGQVVSDASDPAVTTGFVNGKRIEFSGVQAAVDYRTGLDGIGLAGELQIGADVFHLRRRLVDVTGVAPARSDGLIGDPRWEGQLRLRYANRTWGSRVHLNWTGKQLVARDNRGPSPNDIREIDHLKAYATVDAGLFVNAGDDARVTFTVTNLFDRVGQNYYGFVLPISVNDALGRRFAISIEKRW